jgi:hypothetical protein
MPNSAGTAAGAIACCTAIDVDILIFRFDPDSDAGLQDVVSAEHLRSGFSLEGEKETYLHWVAFQMLARASLDSDRSRELILKTAESHWSGGHTEP